MGCHPKLMVSSVFPYFYKQTSFQQLFYAQSHSRCVCHPSCSKKTLDGLGCATKGCYGERSKRENKRMKRKRKEVMSSGEGDMGKMEANVEY